MVEALVPTTVSVAPSTLAFTALGDTVRLMAEVRDQIDRVMEGEPVAWTSAEMMVAAVDSTGLVTAVANGAATITAMAGSASGTAAVTVAQLVSTVEVSPAADTVVERDTVRFEAEARDANGHAVAAAEFTWASGDTSVAVVDASGLVTGAGAGEVEVAATSSGVTGRAQLTVVAPAPTAVAVTPDTVALTALGQTVQLAAEVLDQAGRVMEGEPVSWASGDTMVATVDGSGLVGAAANGAATITATAGSASGEAVVTVMQSAGSVVVSPAAATIALGDTVRLAAEVFDENGHLVAGAEFSWASSDVSVATVDASGLVRGAGEGTATITATAGDAPGDIRDHRREPGPGGAGGALRGHRRTELGQQRGLADGRAAGGMVWGGYQWSRAGDPPGPRWKVGQRSAGVHTPWPDRPDSARTRQPRQPDLAEPLQERPLPARFRPNSAASPI